MKGVIAGFTSSAKDFTRAAYRRSLAVLFFGVSLICAGPLSAQDQQAGPSQHQGMTQQAWSEADFDALFPGADSGWQSGKLDIQLAKSPAGRIRNGAIEDNDSSISVKVLLNKTYTSGDKTIKVSIDSSDMRSVSIVNTAWSKPELSEQFAANGMYAHLYADHRGLSFGGDGERGRVINVGEAGAVTLQCSYDVCAKDLDLLVGALDFVAIEKFVAFEHRY